MKPRVPLKLNEDYSFLIFVSIVAAILFLMSGVSILSAFLTGLFIYLFLRFCYFVWVTILRVIGRGGDKDV